jgi:type IV pilus assembly protein PilA
MIVVAIISILAAIAIPNFLRFQCKSKQAEVKAGLGALWTAEKTFLSEHNTYSTDLVDVSWEPEGSPLYLYGFTVAYPATVAGINGYDPNNNNTIVPGVVGTPPRYSTAHMVDLTGAPLTGSELPFNDCNGQAFFLGAVGDINPDAGRSLDQWSMTDQRQLLNVLNDCTTGN